jgi:hypothetical protein
MKSNLLKLVAIGLVVLSAACSGGGGDSGSSDSGNGTNNVQNVKLGGWLNTNFAGVGYMTSALDGIPSSISGLWIWSDSSVAVTAPISNTTWLDIRGYNSDASQYLYLNSLVPVLMHCLVTLLHDLFHILQQYQYTLHHDLLP